MFALSMVLIGGIPGGLLTYILLHVVLVTIVCHRAKKFEAGKREYTMMRARIIGTVALMMIVVGSHFVATSNKHTVMAASSLPDTSNNIHIGLPFNYNTSSTAMSG